MFTGQPLPYFQPLIDTATGRIAGYEALARLRDDEGTSPAQPGLPIPRWNRHKGTGPSLHPHH